MIYAFQVALTVALYGFSFATADCPQSILIGFSSDDGLAEITGHVSGSTSVGSAGLPDDISPSKFKVSTFARPMVTSVQNGGRRKLSNQNPTIGFVTIGFTNEDCIPLYGTNTDIDSEIATLALLDDVTIVEPNSQVKALDGTLRGPQQQENIRRSLSESRPWGIDMVNVEQLWSLTPQEKVKICIIDTGYDVNHPDLPSEGVTGFTPSGEDGSYGVWNVDGGKHGTHVAGTVGAIGNNNQGVMGVNPDPSKFSFHIAKGLSDGGSGSTDGIINSVQDCVAKGSKVISMSLGGSGSSSLEDMAYIDAYNQGALVIAAAGNDGYETYGFPSSYKSVMSVGSVAEGGGPGSNTYGTLSSFSTYNDQVEISAPGSDVRSTTPNNSYDSYSGTSMATPHVSGVAALLMSHFPACTNNQVRNAMLSSVRAPPTSDSKNAEGWDKYYGFGIVNAGAAYELLSRGCEEAGGKFPTTSAGQKLSDMALGGFEQKNIGCINDEQCYVGPSYGVRRCNVSTNTCFTDTASPPTTPSTPSPSKIPTPNNTLPPINPPSTPAPTPSNPSCEGVTMQVDITTDYYPSDTSWTLTNTCPGGEQVAEGSGYTASQLYSTSYCVSDGRFEFKINDEWGDGICCSAGQGGYVVKKDGIPQVSGDEFGSSETKEFGSCGPTPSPNPTKKPTNVPDSDVTIRVELSTDSYPAETSWALMNVCPGGGEVASGGGYTAPGQFYSTDYVTSRGRFQFVISDAYGDGICCSAGSGEYNVYMDDTLVASGGVFGFDVTEFFGNCGGDGQATSIRVDIRPDDNPSETSWTLFDTCPGGVEVASGSGYTNPEQLYSTKYVTRKSRFAFTIEDAWGDGICCSSGSGSYKVYKDNTLVASGGEFGFTQTTSFGGCDTASSDALASASAPGPLGMYKPLGKPLVDCTKLEITRCKAVSDVCEWKKEEKSSKGIFGMSSLQKKSCHFVE